MQSLKHFLSKILVIVSIVCVVGISSSPLVFAATIPKAIASFTTSLATGILATDTSMTLVSGVDKAGNSISGYICFTIDEGTASEEYACGTASGINVTSMIRGIDPVDGDLEVTALKKVHRRGASVKITDYPVLGILGRILNGNESIPSTIGYASGVGPVQSGDLADKEYVDSVVNGGAVSYEKVIISGVAGATLAAGDLIYIKTTDGEWYETDADTASTVDSVIIGIAQGSGTDGNAISGGVLISGKDTANFSGLSGGSVYYASNTAGAISSSAGKFSRKIGFAQSSTVFILDPYFGAVPTSGQLAALAGSQGVTSSTNKYITQDNTSFATTDQTQTTQNGLSTVGEASTTGLRNDLAQSFIPTKTKIRGVNLYKSADTGTFTGTVTITIKADSGGSPTGSALATATLTNAQWIGTAVGEFEAIFASEYASMVAGSLYWIVIETSTADTSNHPNIGVNTAGGYASGSAKYWNTTDSWVAISTIDLYFKTLEGTASQVVATNSSGKIESAFYSISEMPMPSFQQVISTTVSEPITGSEDFAFGSTSDGSAIFVFNGASSSSILYRFQRDSLTGQYIQTHRVDPTITLPNTDNGAILVIGSYIYVFSNDGTNIIVSRFLAADLTGEQAMTVPTVACTTNVVAWTDGTNAYVVSAASSTTSRKWSISGTTMTAVSTATVADLSGTDRSSMWDGTNAYVLFSDDSPAETIIYKLTAIDGSTKTTTTKILNKEISTPKTGGIIINIDPQRIYIGFEYANWNVSGAVTQISNNMILYPVTKP